jgi:serine/threonine protein kinase
MSPYGVVEDAIGSTGKLFKKVKVSVESEKLTDKYELDVCSCTVLGEGNFSKVYLCQSKVHFNKVAIKDIDEKNSSISRSISKEVNILNSLVNVPGVIKLLDVYQEGQTRFLVFNAYNDGINLENYVLANEIKGTTLKKIFGNIVNTVISLHNNKVFHGDLKPDNILILTSSMNIILLDLGSALFDYGKPLGTYEGFKDYGPPETQKKPASYYAQPASVFQLGIILLFLVTRKVPSRELGEKFDIPLEDWENSNGLIKSCLEKAPEDRITLNDLKNHPLCLID